jgi:hypothetical protein
LLLALFAPKEKMFKRLFCWIYDQWLSKAVNDKNDPLVIFLDFTTGSSCTYCMATRAVMLGIGIGLFDWYGLSLIALSLIFTLGEKKWLCDIKK